MRKNEKTISFSAGKMRYIHDFASGELLINQEIFPTIINVLEEFFIAVHEVYHVEELPGKVYSLVEEYFGFSKDEIKILELSLENNLLCFSIMQLFFEVNSTTVVCNYKKKKILLFALPLMLSSLLQLLFNAADLVVVGRFCGSISVAAVGATGAITNLIINHHESFRFQTRIPIIYRDTMD